MCEYAHPCVHGQSHSLAVLPLWFDLQVVSGQSDLLYVPSLCCASKIWCTGFYDPSLGYSVVTGHTKTADGINNGSPVSLISWTTARTHTPQFNGPLSGTTLVSRYQKGKTNLDFTEARDSEWQWNQLGHMQVCISLQTTTPVPHHSVFYRPDTLPCRPTNSVKALKARFFLSPTSEVQVNYLS